jgi:hypothetical protein
VGWQRLSVFLDLPERPTFIRFTSASYVYWEKHPASCYPPRGRSHRRSRDICFLLLFKASHAGLSQRLLILIGQTQYPR